MSMQRTRSVSGVILLPRSYRDIERSQHKQSPKDNKGIAWLSE